VLAFTIKPSGVPATMTAALVLGCLFAGVLWPVEASASTWRIVRVAQPLLAEGHIEFLDVPYATDSFVPGAEVALTCEPNSIHRVGDDFAARVKSHNAASRFGLALKAGPVWDGKVTFDTLQVSLDARRIEWTTAKLQLPSAAESIVQATVHCIRINASRSGFATKFLRVQVLGSKRFQRFGGVFPVVQEQDSRTSFDLGPGIIPGAENR
jgi:hypothetical protein